MRTGHSEPALIQEFANTSFPIFRITTAVYRKAYLNLKATVSDVKNPCYVGCKLAMLSVNNYSGYGGETRESGR